MPELTDLSPSLQVISTMMIVIVGGVAAFTAYTKTWLDKISPKEKASTDAVVLSASFADAKPIRELNQNVQRNTECVERLCAALDAQTRASYAVASAADRRADSDIQTKHAIDGLTEEIRRMGDE